MPTCTRPYVLPGSSTAASAKPRDAANRGLSTGNRFASAYFHLHLGAINLAQGHARESIAHYRKAQSIVRREFNNDKDMKLVTNVLTAECVL